MSASDPKAIPAPKSPPRDSLFYALASLALLAAILAWYWPGGGEFRSDDYVAIAYVQDWHQVLSDFVGPQYGISRVALFHRPLITLSIFFDSLLGGNQPFFPLLMNALAHGVNALLLLALARRALPPLSAFAAVAFWAFHPLHSEAVSWMVGRVDTHSAFLILLTILLEQRSIERGQRTRPLTLLSCLLAFWTKESSFVLPGLVFLLALANRKSLRSSLQRMLPFGFLLVAALAWRLVFLGEAIGGYAEGHLSGGFLLHLPGFLLPPVFETWTGILAALALILFLWTWFRLPKNSDRSLSRKLVLLLLASFLLSLPAAGASGQDRGPATDRYAYLSFAPLAGVSALGTALSSFLLLGAQAPTALLRKQELTEVNAKVRSIRAQVLEALATDSGPDPLLLPAPLNAHGRPLFAVGFDRLGHPPFYPGNRSLLPDRDLFGQKGTPIPLSRPGLEAAYTGPKSLDAKALAAIHEGRAQAQIQWKGPKIARLRLIFLTAGGRASVEVPAPRARAPLELALLSPLLELPRLNALQALYPPLDLSLDPRPFVLVEGLDPKGQSLGRPERPIRLPFTRNLGRIVVPLKNDAYVPLIGALLLLGLAFILHPLRRPPG